MRRYQIVIITLFCILLIQVSNCGKKGRKNPLDSRNPETHGDPFNLIAAIDDRGIKLSWNKIDMPNIQGYNVYRSLEENTGYDNIGHTNKNTYTFIDTNIQKGYTYHYKVAVYDQQGKENSQIHIKPASIVIQWVVSFKEPFSCQVGKSPRSIFSADLDGDLYPDLAVVNELSHDMSVLKNKRDGTFQDKVNYALPPYARHLSVYCADLDGDSYLDAAVAGPNVHIFKNNGDGTFQPGVYYSAGYHSYSIFCADIDGDLDLDLVVANEYSDNVSILKNNGDGTFQPKVDYDVGDSPHSVYCADLDGDKDLDLATANFGSENVSVLINNADGTFQSRRTAYNVGDSPHSICCADLDGDRDFDIAVANYYGDNISILKNNGDGTFQDNIKYSAGHRPASVLSADIDGDGDQDIAVASLYSDSITILNNNGYGDFKAKACFYAGDGSYSVFCADLDGDGDLDLTTTNYHSEGISVLLSKIYDK